MYSWIKLAVLCLIFWTSTVLIAKADNSPASQPGSVDDPVITKSYFDQNIQKKVAEELSKQSVNEEKIKQLVAAELAKITPSTGGSAKPTETDSSLSIIKLEQSQTLYGGGGTELIVRTGKVAVFSSDESGIADVTSGKDITASSIVELNHLLIVPREGRGIKPDPKNKQDIYVMVRGSYLLTNADGSKATP